MSTVTEKKRKRSDDASSTGKKVQAGQKLGKPVRLQRALKSTPVWAPGVDTSVSFNVPGNVPFHVYSKNTSSKRKDGKSELMLHANAHPIMEYTAKEDRSSMVDCGVNHFVGVFDPATNTVKFVEAKKMLLRGVVKSRLPSRSDESAEKMRTTAQRIELNKTFGTRKAKKAIDDVMLNALPTASANDQTKLSAAELATLDAVKRNTATMLSREELDEAARSSKPIPRPNLEATEIQDVYQPELIIGPEVLHSIPVKDWMDSVASNENVQLRSRFVAGRLVRIANSTDSVQRMRLLRFLYYLIMYVSMSKKGRDGRKTPPRAVFIEKIGAPEIVTSYLFKTFTINGLMDNFHHQLALAHAAVWACVLENFEIDTTDLRFDLNLDPTNMTQIFREIGARPKQYKNPQTKAQSTMAKLSLPLVFPKLSRGAARK
ncbi:DNA-directed RNA polymerase I subunit rpa49 [Ceratocystis pirilliformis]|uniref:DNA-directed RNA polymerase I subunit rpa49 n=1 Tax=Ceratocystis pirilliformis TaxID=259994 RepID=A0ABR3Z4R3_9PEZI